MHLPNLKRVWLGALLIVGLDACSHHVVRRSALVPAVAPPLNTGQAASDRLVGLTLGNSSFLRESKPVALSGTTPDAGRFPSALKTGSTSIARSLVSWRMLPVASS